MAWMTAQGETGRVVWRDRTAARNRLDSVTRLVDGRWVTVEATVTPVTSWSDGYVTSE